MSFNEMSVSKSGIVTETALLQIVQSIETKFNQTENDAIIEIGVTSGFCVAILILMLIFLRTVCLRIAFPSKDVCDIKMTDQRVERETECASTEGAYRSDSESDDEGQGEKLSKEAQKRSRSSSGV